MTGHHEPQEVARAADGGASVGHTDDAREPLIVEPSVMRPCSKFASMQPPICNESLKMKSLKICVLAPQVHPCLSSAKPLKLIAC